MSDIQIGNIQAKPGTIQYGKWDLLEHPTGHTEFLPVIIAQGKKNGPCIWLTAGIHGNEQTGPLVIHDLLTDDLLSQLSGTIIAIPALNPAGLRVMNRSPYFLKKDPNRLWPDGKNRQEDDSDKEPPSALEASYKKLFETMVNIADFHIDYHNAWIDSISFVFRDRVLYRKDVEGDNEKAQALADKMDEMIQAYGHTIINEFPSEKYIDEDLHRSTSGCMVLLGKKPAITVELGTGEMPNPGIIDAACAGTRNVMRWAKMIPGEFEEINQTQVCKPEFPIRRKSVPRVSRSCVIKHLVQPGDSVKKGQPIAKATDIWGRPLEDSIIVSEYDGIIIGRNSGIFYYPGQALFCMGVKDDAELTGPYPDDFFKK